MLLKNVTTELIARQDSDDFSLPTRLEDQVNLITNKNYDAVYTRAINKQSQTKIPGLSFYIPSKLLIKYKNPYIHGSLMIKHEVLKSLNYYSEDFYYAQDYKLMIDALDKFVSLDIPFLKAERTERVQNLKTIMDRGDISTSEKFRKVTEAYQIESDYGRTIEAYRSEVSFDGETFNADFLRVGRVSLAFVTSNGDKAGFWNKATGAWEESSASVKRSTIDGLKIALKQAPPTLITITLTSYENSN